VIKNVQIEQREILMPTYEYKCNDEECAEQFEKIQSFNSKPTTKCPSCNTKATRLISSVSVQFKGSGWYSTANRSSKESDSD
jgi:putative FmdB family regulatory protein|tara:strand:- start:149 stop:394 length:246 start_codon:yes stop_codon:yes gene_type:complete